MIRRLAFVALVVIAIGFIHRKRRRQQTAETIAPTARPTSGTTTVGVVAEVPGYEATTMHLRPATAPLRDEPEKS